MTSFQIFLEDTIQQSAEIARSYFGKTTSTTKEGDNNQVLTEADLKIGEQILNAIQKEYPDHNVIDEEAGVINQGSEFTWVVDPIDGTSNFASGVPMYGIMIGLLRDDVPIAGAVSLPSFRQLCLAEKGMGAFLDKKRIHVTSEEKLLSTLVAYQIDGHQENPQLTRDECRVLAEITLACRNIRTAGSCFDWIMVARGSFGACLNRTSKVWDNVANQIILEEAGGIYTDFFGNPMQYAHAMERVGDNYTACCGAQALHAQLQRIIHSVE